MPHPFPPQTGFEFDAKLLKKVDEATRLLGKLDGITKLLPNSDYFILMYLRKDAASSSQIEGTQATMIDAIEAEAQVTTNIPKDVDDILHYIKALNYGVDFFLEGVIEIAKEAIAIVGKITTLRERDMAKVQTLGKRAAESAAMLLPKLYGQPVVNVALVQKWTGFTRACAQTVIKRFIKMGILEPKDKDKTYGQSYIYKEYTDIFTSES